MTASAAPGVFHLARLVYPMFQPDFVTARLRQTTSERVERLRAATRGWQRDEWQLLSHELFDEGAVSSLDELARHIRFDVEMAGAAFPAYLGTDGLVTGWRAPGCRGLDFDSTVAKIANVAVDAQVQRIVAAEHKIASEREKEAHYRCRQIDDQVGRYISSLNKLMVALDQAEATNRHGLQRLPHVRAALQGALQEAVAASEAVRTVQDARATQAGIVAGLIDPGEPPARIAEQETKLAALDARSQREVERLDTLRKAAEGRAAELRQLEEKIAAVQSTAATTRNDMASTLGNLAQCRGPVADLISSLDDARAEAELGRVAVGATGTPGSSRIRARLDGLRLWHLAPQSGVASKAELARAAADLKEQIGRVERNVRSRLAASAPAPWSPA
jgi:hypothetical protein